MKKNVCISGEIKITSHNAVKDLGESRFLYKNLSNEASVDMCQLCKTGSGCTLTVIYNGKKGINQFLLIPCVIPDFLCIHPFRDGNGRRI